MGATDISQQQTADSEGLRLGQVCGVLLASPTTIVYAFSVTAPLTTLLSATGCQQPLEFLGLADGRPVHPSHIAFRNACATLDLCPSLVLNLQMPEAPQVFNATILPRSMHKAKSKLETFVCSIKQYDEDAREEVGGIAYTPVAICEWSAQEQQSCQTQAIKFKERYGEAISPELIWEATMVLNTRQADGLFMDEVLWNADDFVSAYKMYKDFVEKLDLATLPLPDVFCTALVRERMIEDRNADFLLLEDADTIIEDNWSILQKSEREEYHETGASDGIGGEDDSAIMGTAMDDA